MTMMRENQVDQQRCASRLHHHNRDVLLDCIILATIVEDNIQSRWVGFGIAANSTRMNLPHPQLLLHCLFLPGVVSVKLSEMVTPPAALMAAYVRP